jgi:hypothetical protein
MNADKNLTELEDVLDTIVAATDQPSPGILDYWLREYPQFGPELVDFLASWTLMCSATAAAVDVEQFADDSKVDGHLVLRGISIVQNLLHETSQRPQTQNRLNSLLGRAKAAGIALHDFARLTHLGEVVVRKLDRRLIRFSSIPKQAIKAIADTLGCQAEAVSLYLQGPATLVSGTRYRADRAPQLADAEDFLDAVDEDPTMTEEDRRSWRDVVLAERA